MGEVVGINTAALLDAQGIGFSTSTFTLVPVLQSLLEHGRVVWPWLGVMVADIGGNEALELELGGRRGILITQALAEGPAERAGVLAGDVLAAMDGFPVPSVRELQRLMRREFGVGQEALLRLLREGEEHTVTVTLAEMPRR